MLMRYRFSEISGWACEQKEAGGPGGPPVGGGDAS